MKPPIIIEFNGIPGCGKTTLANHLVKFLRSNGYEVITLSDIWYYKSKGFRKKINSTVKALGNRNFYYFIGLVVNFLINYKFTLKRIRFALRLFKLYMNLNNALSQKHFEYLVLEEGYSQFVLSIIHKDKIANYNKLEVLIEFLYKSFKNIIAINCILSIDESIKRIRKRGLRSRRFDSLADDLLFPALNQNQKSLSLIRNYQNRIWKIDMLMDQDVDICCQAIMKFIENT